MSDENRRSDKLIKAYNQMMLHVSEALSKATHDAEPKLNKALEAAEERLEELGELTREEIDRVSQYLRRDIEDAASYFASSEAQELKEWLRFDLELIEERALEALLSIADPTVVDRLKLEETLFEANEYKTGEITGPGTLVCEKCGEELHFHHTGHIPPCPKCHATTFVRKEALES